MDQAQFQETIQQLSEAVGQKESLEQKLNRIKEKIQKAKQIKNQTIQASLPSTTSSLAHAATADGALVNYRMLAGATPGGALNYQTF